MGNGCLPLTTPWPQCGWDFGVTLLQCLSPFQLSSSVFVFLLLLLAFWPLFEFKDVAQQLEKIGDGKINNRSPFLKGWLSTVVVGGLVLADSKHTLNHFRTNT